MRYSSWSELLIVCQSLDEARRVPGVVVVIVGDSITAYQSGDAIPAGALVNPADVAADQTRLDAEDQAIAANTIGNVTPKNVAELKAMTVTEYSAWFDANVTTAAQAIALLKRITLIIIRRVF